MLWNEGVVEGEREHQIPSLTFFLLPFLYIDREATLPRDEWAKAIVPLWKQRIRGRSPEGEEASDMDLPSSHCLDSVGSQGFAPLTLGLLSRAF